MVMREVVGATAALFLGIFLLWFMLPLLNTAKDSVVAQVDITDPTNATLIAIGDGVYSALPFVSLLVIGYLLFAYATKNVPFDVT